MMNFVLRKLGSTVIVMMVVAVIVFIMIRVGPGDPAAVIAGERANTDDIEAIRKSLGLDEPLVFQFFHWVSRLLSGDLGQSLFSRKPVLELIAGRLEPTLSLAATTMTFAVCTAVPLGIVAAWQMGRWLDRVIMALAVAAFSFPIFIIGYGLVWAFALKLRWLPVQGFRPLSQGPALYLNHLVLPSLTLGLVFMALLTRMTRSTMIDVLGEDYIRTAQSKGVAQMRVLFRHALKNAAIPIVTTIGSGIALLIGGVVVVESVFAIPGIGRLTIEAVTQRDYPVIQGVLLLASLAYVVINLLVDLSYGLFDPRIRSLSS